MKTTPPSTLRNNVSLGAKPYLALVSVAVLATFTTGCEGGRSRKVTLKADSPKLNVKNIDIPATITLTEIGRVTCEVDLSWVSENFEKIMRKGLPREGGSGGDRYYFSNFRLTANASGAAVGSVHVKLMNYSYFHRPAPTWRYPLRRVQEDLWKGTVEEDVIATITPRFVSGAPETVTSVAIVKTRESGFVRIWNDALPKIWFSLDRKIQTATNAANRNQGPPVLEVREDPELKPFIDDVLKRKLVVGEDIRFKQTGTGLILVFRYKVAGGAKAYWDIYQLWRTHTGPIRQKTDTRTVSAASASEIASDPR